MDSDMQERNGRGTGGVLVETGAVLALFMVSLALFPVSAIVDGGPLAQAFPFVRMAAFLLLVSWLLSRHGQSWADLGLRQPRWGRAAAALVLGYLAVIAFGLLAMPALRSLGLEHGAAEVFDSLRGNGAALAYWLAVSWFAAAIGEELIARGWLMNRLELILGGRGRAATIAALVGQAAIFGAAHAWNGAAGMVIAGAMGLILGCVYLGAGRNLWPAIILHGIVDSQSFLALYAGVAPGAS